MLKRLCVACVVLLTAAVPALAGDMNMEPPGGAYQKVSALVELPDFIPGLGALYVDPATLPAGPFLAYDRGGKLVSTIYMVPLAAMQNQETLNGLAVGTDQVHKVDMYYNGGHPGVPDEHYHIVLWHVDPDMAELE